MSTRFISYLNSNLTSKLRKILFASLETMVLNKRWELSKSTNPVDISIALQTRCIATDNSVLDLIQPIYDIPEMKNITRMLVAYQAKKNPKHEEQLARFGITPEIIKV